MHLIHDLSVAMRCIVVAKDIQRPQYADAWGIHGHQDHALLAVGLGLWIRLAHENGDGAPGIHGPACPPLVAAHSVASTIPAHATAKSESAARLAA